MLRVIVAYFFIKYIIIFYFIHAIFFPSSSLHVVARVDDKSIAVPKSSCDSIEFVYKFYGDYSDE